MKDSRMNGSNPDSVASQSASRWLAALAMLAGTALTVPAFGCPPDESDGESGLRQRSSLEARGQVKMLHDVPLVDLQFKAAPSVHMLRDLPLLAMGMSKGDATSTVVMSSEENGTTYEVRIENGKTTAKIDGKTLPSSQVRSLKGKIELLDKDGTVVHTFPQLSMNGGVTIEDGRDWGQAPAVALAPQRASKLRLVEPSGDSAVAIATSNPPPVMMGITMSETTDDAGTRITVDKVMDGLPAGKAGLKSGDKLLKLDGEDIDGVMEFRESLADRKAGDEITLKVLRDEKEMEIKVKLEAFDSKTLEPLMVEVQRAREAHAGTVTGDHNEAWYEDAKRAIETARKSLGDSNISDSARTSARQTLESALKSLEAAKQNQQQPQWWNQDGALVAPGQAGVYVPRAPRALSNTRVDDLEQKLDLLSERLDKALNNLDQRQGAASADSLEQAKAQLKKLQQENAALQKKITELQAKVGGN